MEKDENDEINEEHPQEKTDYSVEQTAQSFQNMFVTIGNSYNNHQVHCKTNFGSSSKFFFQISLETPATA